MRNVLSSFVIASLGFVAATAAVDAQAQTTYTEVQSSTAALGDTEFDWGRDGIYCPSCNFGYGNARLNWTDRQGNLWLAHLDPNTGLLISPDGKDELVDTSAFFWNVYGNGPEWAFSTQGKNIVSQLVYSRHVPGMPATTGYAGAAFATQAQGTWEPHFFPGAIGDGSAAAGTNNSNLPEASQCNTDPQATAVYKNFASPPTLFMEKVTAGPNTVPTAIPLTGVSNGIGERFIPCTHQLTFQGDAPPGPQGNIIQQVFWYNWDTGVVKQLTTDATGKYSGFMFKAPDFGDNFILVTISKKQVINVYAQSGTDADGAPDFTLVNTIVSPDPTTPYMNSMEPFINCTPTCTTYVYFTVAKTGTAQQGVTTPIGLGVAALNPATPLNNLLAPANYSPAVQRLDPEYYISANGPYIYYNMIEVQSGSTKYKNLGLWFIDTQLGVPSGPCVGSSAEGGLMPGC